MVLKIFKRIILWSAFSIILQLSGMFYINNYFLSSNSDLQISKVVNNNKKSDAAVYVPEGAKNVSVSYDGSYIAYYDSEVLKVINTKTGKAKTIEFDKGVKVSYYKWLSDRNRMLIAEKHSTSSGSKFELAYYDVAKDSKDLIKELKWTDKEAEVSDIQASPLTNVIYIKLSLSGNRNSIYWLNIMKDMTKITTKNDVIGDIMLIPHEDKLVYEDSVSNQLYVTKESDPLNINGVINPSLISVDNNDNIYVGDIVNGKISKIYFGSLTQDRNTFKEIDLGSEVDKNDIYVSLEGKVYIIDNLKGSVKEMGSGKEYIFPGTYVQIYEGGILSLSDMKVTKTELK
jgi:hypothetical protein